MPMAAMANAIWPEKLSAAHALIAFSQLSNCEFKIRSWRREWHAQPHGLPRPCAGYHEVLFASSFIIQTTQHTHATAHTSRTTMHHATCTQHATRNTQTHQESTADVTEGKFSQNNASNIVDVFPRLNENLFLLAVLLFGDHEAWAQSTSCLCFAVLDGARGERGE
jgi:hypothetical protein